MSTSAQYPAVDLERCPQHESTGISDLGAREQIFPQPEADLPVRLRPFRDFLNGESEEDCRQRIATNVEATRREYGRSSHYRRPNR
jgi:hypothetical protein